MQGTGLDVVVSSVGSSSVERSVGAVGVAAGWFDLDHLGPEVGQHLAQERSGDTRGELQDSHVGEGLLHDGLGFGRRRGDTRTYSAVVVAGAAVVGPAIISMDHMGGPT